MVSNQRRSASERYALVLNFMVRMTSNFKIGKGRKNSFFANLKIISTASEACWKGRALLIGDHEKDGEEGSLESNEEQLRITSESKAHPFLMKLAMDATKCLPNVWSSCSDG